MKKSLFFLALPLLFPFLFLSLFVTPAYAACTPPTDYSSCQVSSIGPKIAANTDPANYSQIRQTYNTANPQVKNQQIPVTVIYTTEDLANTSWLNKNLEAMQESGLQPTIRIASSGFGVDGWAQITPEEARIDAQNLNHAFSRTSFSQTPIVYFGNEPNLPAEWGGKADSNSFAQSFASFILAAGESRNFQIYVPPVAGHQGGAELNFLAQILNYKMSNGQTIAQGADGAALTLYDRDPKALATLYQQLTQFYEQQGVSNFGISELGPLINGRLLQNEEDMDQWKQSMSQVFKDFIANSDLFKDAEFITTSFFLDVDGDGNPDQTLLVIIDAKGNVTILDLAVMGGGSLKYKRPKPFFPVANGDWFRLKKTVFGPPGNPPAPPEVWVKNDTGHKPEPYNDLNDLTAMITGDNGNPQKKDIMDFGVWERIRLPGETNVDPSTKFPKKSGRNVSTDIDCVGETQGNSRIKLDDGLSQTSEAFSVLTQTFVTVRTFQTTDWSQNYPKEGKDCNKQATGLEGQRAETSAIGAITILGFTFPNVLQVVSSMEEFVCGLPGVDQLCRKYQTDYYVSVQPKLLTDPTTAKIPELSYGFSKKRTADDPEKGEEVFGGGALRIFFSPGMEQIGETEGKLYQGEPVHGKGIQDYATKDGWEAADGSLENKPADDYGLAGTKESWNFVQQALTPPNF